MADTPTATPTGAGPALSPTSPSGASARTSPTARTSANSSASPSQASPSVTVARQMQQLVTQAMGGLRTVGRTVVSVASALMRTWRRSLQFRVVSTTVLLGLVVVSLLGSYLYNEIATGLQDDRIRTSEREAQALTAQAQAQWESTTQTTATELNTIARDIMESKLTPPGTGSSRYVVMLRGVNNSSAVQLNSFASGDLALSSVSQDIRERVAADPTHQQTMVSDITTSNGRVPAVFVGSGVEIPRAGRYDLYYVYPMTQEIRTMGLISTAFGIAGLILTFLVGAVAWVVTKQVVSPVRRAAEVAERLASGKLNERMPSRGEDDLALLATSFNAMADSLQAQIRQLEGLSRVQQRFVSDVSHELRTPLTTIRMAGDLLYDSRTDFDPIAGRSVELLQGELDRFESLLSDLLEISRFDAGAAALDVAPIDLRGTAAGVVASAQPLADRRGTTIEIVASGPVSADVDERRVERILRNLVVNAIEHSDGKPVTVHLRQGDGAVAVVVEDHGVGLRQGEASMVFTRFWRADPARARTTGGTGLGLAIALEDARLHNGWLQAWGEPGVGSRFRLTLPQRSGEPLTSSPLALSPGERT